MSHRACYNHREAYYASTVDTNNEVEPWLYLELCVLVAQHLKAVRTALVVLLLWLTPFIQARDEAIESTEH